MKILFIECCSLSFYQNLLLNFVIECVSYCSVEKFCRALPWALKRPRGNQKRPGQVGRTAGRGFLWAQVLSVVCDAVQVTNRNHSAWKFVCGPIFFQNKQYFKELYQHINQKIYECMERMIITYSSIPREKLLQYFCVCIYIFMCYINIHILYTIVYVYICVCIFF